MDQAKIVEQAVLSVDANYLKERYPGQPNIPSELYCGARLTERYKKNIRRICGAEYPGGEIGMVIDFSLFHTFGNGYLFTDKGFYPTKGNLCVSSIFKKRGVLPLSYVDITGIEVVKKYDNYSYIRITTLDDDEMIGYAGIYAPYICEVIKKIMHDLWGRSILPTPYQNKKQRQAIKRAAKAAKPAPAPEPQKAPVKSAPAAVTIDDLWNEAIAADIQPMKSTPTPQTPDIQLAQESAKTAPEKKQTSAVQAPKKEFPSEEQPQKQVVAAEEKPKPAKAAVSKLIYKSQIRMISDGSADHKAAALCQWLQNAANPTLFHIPDFTSTQQAHKTLLESPVIDHLVIYTDVIQSQPNKLLPQLSGLKLAKNTKVFVYLDSFDDQETDELIEQEITDLFDYVMLSENKLFFIRCLATNQDASYRNFFDKLQWECLDRYRHAMPFRMPVERVFHIKMKDGQIIEAVGGQVLQGSIQTGEKVRLVDCNGAPQGTVRRILDPWKEDVDIALPGMDVDLWLTDIPREAVVSGKLAAINNDGVEIKDQLTGKVYVYKKDEGDGFTPLYEGMRCSVTVGSAQSLAVITQIHTNDHMLSPGDFGYIEIQTATPVPTETGMAFLLHNGEKCITAGHICRI